MNLNEMIELNKNYKKEISKNIIKPSEMVKISLEEGLINEETANKYAIIAGICEALRDFGPEPISQEAIKFPWKGLKAGKDWETNTKLTGDKLPPIRYNRDSDTMANAMQELPNPEGKLKSAFQELPSDIKSIPIQKPEVNNAITAAANATTKIEPAAAATQLGHLQSVGAYFAKMIGKKVPLTDEQKMAITTHPQAFFEHLRTIFKAKGLVKYLPGGETGMLAHAGSYLANLGPWAQFASLFGAGILGVGVLKLAKNLVSKIRNWWKGKSANKAAAQIATRANESVIAHEIKRYNSFEKKNDRKAYKFFLLDTLSENYNPKDAISIFSAIIDTKMLSEAVKFYAKA